MSVKTVVIIGYAEHSETKERVEFSTSGVFGEGLPYETANDLIVAYLRTKQVGEWSPQLTNVVIG